MYSSAITKDYDVIIRGRPRSLRYRCVFFPSAVNLRHRCILVLTGTSTQLSDVRYFISRLLQQKWAVAAIERSIGSPLTFFENPAIARPLALSNFIERLHQDFNISVVDVVAHSYAAQEVVRALDGRPEEFLPRIGTISLINPSGFGNTGGFFAHCLRFVFLFVLRDYYRSLKGFWDYGDCGEAMKADYKRLMQGVRILAINTISNPVRTLREVADIVTCDLRPAVRRLVTRDGWRLTVFLSRQDTLVSADRTRDFFRNELPSVRCVDLPGNHMDPLLREGCVQIVLNTFEGE